MRLVEKMIGPARGLVVVHLSRVGFDVEHRRAVVYLAMSCGNLCGAGEIIELRRDRQSWSIVRRIVTLRM
jgi:hypothetical protein